MDVERTHESSDTVARTKQHHLVANAVTVQQSGKVGIFRRDSGAGENTFERELGARGQLGQGSGEIPVILVGMPAGDASDDELAFIYRPGPTQPTARPLIRLEDSQIITVRN